MYSEGHAFMQRLQVEKEAKENRQHEIDDLAKERREKANEMTPVTVERTAEQIVNDEVIAIKLPCLGNKARLAATYVR